MAGSGSEDLLDILIDLIDELKAKEETCLSKHGDQHPRLTSDFTKHTHTQASHHTHTHTPTIFIALVFTQDL